MLDTSMRLFLATLHRYMVRKVPFNKKFCQIRVQYLENRMRAEKELQFIGKFHLRNENVCMEQKISKILDPMSKTGEKRYYRSHCSHNFSVIVTCFAGQTALNSRLRSFTGFLVAPLSSILFLSHLFSHQKLFLALSVKDTSSTIW